MENLKNRLAEKDAQALNAQASSSEELRLDAPFHLSKDRGFYGPGTHRLLQLTEETGSLLEACRRMGLSYSKGRKIILLTEQQIGFPVIERQQGGRSGGHSSLTEEGQKLMRCYHNFCMEAEEYLNELFQKHFHTF